MKRINRRKERERKVDPECKRLIDGEYIGKEAQRRQADAHAAANISISRLSFRAKDKRSGCNGFGGTAGRCSKSPPAGMESCERDAREPCQLPPPRCICPQERFSQQKEMHPVFHDATSVARHLRNCNFSPFSLYSSGHFSSSYINTNTYPHVYKHVYIRIYLSHVLLSKLLRTEVLSSSCSCKPDS